MRALPAVVTGAVVLTMLPRLAAAAVTDPNFTESVFVAPSGLGGTTGIAWATDGSNRLFMLRQIGQVRVVADGVLLKKAFASVSPIVTDSECGLLGIAFDPSFAENGYVYFFVTTSTTEQQIVRYAVSGNEGVEKTVVVAGLPTLGSGHDGGAVGFGPDGKLYWAVGDLYSGVGAGDDLESLAAKVGRANRDGSVPADNPFVDGAGPNEDRIWARGFRNPFSFTWQPSTERLWVNVVGAQYEQIFAPLAGDHGGWGEFQNDQPDGYLAPLISYRTHGSDARAVVAAKRRDGVTQFTTAQPHGFRVGGKVTVTGVADASFAGSGYVGEVPTSTTFSLAQPGNDADSAGGTATSLALGAAVTGGAFWDSSAVPEPYRGNFFFTDYVSGHIARVVAPPGEPGETPRVSSVDYWATADRPIDIDIGLDGDLYYATFGGGVYRVSYLASTQSLVVSRLHVRADEGSRVVVGVRLALAPTEPVLVSIENVAGDLDVMPMPSQLTFDATNWSVPQLVSIAAAHDGDADSDRAKVEVAADGLEPELIDVRVTEDDSPAPVAGAGGAPSSAAEAGAAGVEAGGARPGDEAAGAPGAADAAGAAQGGDRAGPELGASGWATTEPHARDDATCGCRVPLRRRAPNAPAWLIGLAALSVTLRRASLNRRRGAPPSPAAPASGQRL